MVFLCTLTTLEQKGQQIRPLSCRNGILCNDTHHICTCSPHWQTAATRSIRSLLRNIITHTTKSTSITVEKLVEKKKLMLNKHPEVKWEAKMIRLKRIGTSFLGKNF
jgi:hypothetical protein